MTADQWKHECAYIAGLADKRGNVHEMNYDYVIAIRYCEMQRNAATKEGFHDAAEYIQHCIDDLKSYYCV